MCPHFEEQAILCWRWTQLHGCFPSVITDVCGAAADGPRVLQNISATAQVQGVTARQPPPVRNLDTANWQVRKSYGTKTTIWCLKLGYWKWLKPYCLRGAICTACCSLLWVVSDWIPFMWRKAVLWITGLRSGGRGAGCYLRRWPIDCNHNSLYHKQCNVAVQYCASQFVRCLTVSSQYCKSKVTEIAAFWSVNVWLQVCSPSERHGTGLTFWRLKVYVPGTLALWRLTTPIGVVPHR